MALPSGNDEIVRWIMEMDAKAALSELRKLRGEIEKTAGANGFKKLEAAAAAFASQVASLSKKQQRDWKVVLQELMAVDAQLSKMQSRVATGRGAETRFGSKIGSAFSGITQQDIASIIEGNIALGKYKVTQDGVIQSTKAHAEATDRAEKSHRRFVRSIDAVRIALGAIVAMAVFRVIQFFDTAIRKTIDSVKQLEMSLYKLGVAERALSKSGVEVSMAGFRDIIKEILDLYPYISEIDATKLVSTLAVLTKDLGLTEQQLRGLAKAIPILATNAGISVEQATDQVINGLANSGRGWKDLGIIVDAEIIKQRAVSDGLVKTRDAYDKLTAEQKQQVEVIALLNILNDSVAEGQASQAQYMETLDAATRQTTSTWEDFLATLGRVMGPALIEGLKLVIDELERANDWLIKNEESITKIVATISGLIAMKRTMEDTKEEAKGLDGALSNALKSLSPGLGFIISEMRSAGRVGKEDLFDAFQKGFDEAIRKANEFGKSLETPTNNTKALGDAIDDISELTGFDDLAKDLEKLGEKMNDLNEEFDIDQKRKEFDYLRDIERLQEDYAIKRQKIIEDANEKVADANRKHQNQQKDDEAKFQEQMRQLREKFLFNLEDALRERDARQVLRLQRQYQMDKTALENEHALRKQEQDRQHQEDLAKIREDRNDRLAELAEEERIRLERERQDYELKKKREEEDHARDLEDLKKQINDRLMEFAKAIGEEYDLNEQGVTALYNLLQQYYGPSGVFNQLYDYSYKSMVAKAQQMLSSVNQIVSQSRAALLSASQIALGSGDYFQRHPMTTLPNDFYQRHIGGQAKGGTYLATRPTTATFGEAGPEIAQFIPVSKLKAGNGNGSSAGMGMNGNVEIDLLLSPDLEARVVRNTLSETAKVVTHVRRNKD